MCCKNAATHLTLSAVPSGYVTELVAQLATLITRVVASLPAEHRPAAVARVVLRGMMAAGLTAQVTEVVRHALGDGQTHTVDDSPTRMTRALAAYASGLSAPVATSDVIMGLERICQSMDRVQ